MPHAFDTSAASLPVPTNLPSYQVGDVMTFVAKTGKTYPVEVIAVLPDGSIRAEKYRNAQITEHTWAPHDLAELIQEGCLRAMTRDENVHFQAQVTALRARADRMIISLREGAVK